MQNFPERRYFKVFELPNDFLDVFRVFSELLRGLGPKKSLGLPVSLVGPLEKFLLLFEAFLTAEKYPALVVQVNSFWHLLLEFALLGLVLVMQLSDKLSEVFVTLTRCD